MHSLSRLILYTDINLRALWFIHSVVCGIVYSLENKYFIHPLVTGVHFVHDVKLVIIPKVSYSTRRTPCFTPTIVFTAITLLSFFIMTRVHTYNSLEHITWATKIQDFLFHVITSLNHSCRKELVIFSSGVIDYE